MDRSLLRRRVAMVYPYLTGDELERQVTVAEYVMNEALENRQWHVVRRRRHQILALRAERRRRLRGGVSRPAS